MHGKMPEIRQVQAIKPDHGTGAIFTMIVPVHGGREDHVSAVHFDTSAMDSSEAAIAFDDEAHSEGRVSMGGGRLVRHYELEASIDSVGCVRGSWKLLGLYLGDVGSGR